MYYPATRENVECATFELPLWTRDFNKNPWDVKQNDILSLIFQCKISTHLLSNCSIRVPEYSTDAT